MALDLLIAIAAITGPEVAEPPPCRLWSLRSASVALELLDARGATYWFVRAEQLDYDLREMRSRYSDLKDAPKLCDAERFPSAELCQSQIEWNRSYKAWLESRALLFPSERWIAEAIEECEELWKVWDCVRDAVADHYYVYWRRKSLARLRGLIGPNLYYAGCLPAPAPVWRMRRAE